MTNTKITNKYKLKALKSWVSVAIVLAAIVLYFLNLPTTAAGIRSGLSSCIDVVVPSLFPFMIICAYIIRSGMSDILSKPFKLFSCYVLHLPESVGSIFLLSLIGGYPIGARGLCSLVKNGRISKTIASHMLCFCVNAGPAFLISAIGSRMLCSVKAGIILFAAQTTASLIIAIAVGIFRKIKKVDRKAISSTSYACRPADAFVFAVNDATRGIVSICAFVIIFSGILSLINGLNLPSSLMPALQQNNAAIFKALIGGTLEVVNGCSLAANIKGILALLMADLFCSFGGLSVICQTISAVKEADINVKPYLISRFFHMAISAGTVMALVRAFPDAVPAFSQAGAAMSFTGTSPIASILLLLLCGFFVLSRRENFLV